MSKRKLDSKYKDLVEYVNDKHSEFESLATILKRAIKEGNKMLDGGNPLWDILNPLYTTILDSDDFSDLTKTIVDIYNGNYELTEPKTYWQLKISGVYGNPMYAFMFGFPGGTIGITLKDDNKTADKLARDELINGLDNTNTNLTIDNFKTVEELE